MANAARKLKVIEDYSDEQIVRQIGRLRQAFLECRVLRHSWDIKYLGLASRAPDDLATRARSHPLSPDGVRVLRCRKCHTERIDFCWIGYGRSQYAYRLVARHYRYPDDYKIEGASGHSDWLHEEMFRREIGES